jgi:hydroxylaminobenzene mutase
VSAPSVTQRFLAPAGAWLLLLGLFTGGFAAAAMTGQLPADGHAALASHLNALLGSFWIFAVAWTLPMLGYGPVGQKRLAWLVVVPNFGNWLVTAIKAFVGVGGLALDRNPANNAVFVALNVVVVLPSLAAGVAWAWGFRRAPATSTAVATQPT